MRTIGRCAAWFCALIALFCLLMTVAYSVPEERIEWHREYSLVVLEIEESWESLGNIFGFHGQPGMLDNTTDRTMLECAKISGGGVQRSKRVFA